MCQPFGGLSIDGYGLATAWPDGTTHIEKLIMSVVFLWLLPGILTHPKYSLSNRNAKPAT